jgi:UPF0506
MPPRADSGSPAPRACYSATVVRALRVAVPVASLLFGACGLSSQGEPSPSDTPDASAGGAAGLGNGGSSWTNGGSAGTAGAPNGGGQGGSAGSLATGGGGVAGAGQAGAGGANGGAAGSGGLPDTGGSGGNVSECAGDSCSNGTPCCAGYFCVMFNGSAQFHTCLKCIAPSAQCYGDNQCCSGHCSAQGAQGSCLPS